MMCILLDITTDFYLHYFIYNILKYILLAISMSFVVAVVIMAHLHKHYAWKLDSTHRVNT